MRWENHNRWYEARVVRDLFGDWTVVRRWGGKHTLIHGQLIEWVGDPAQGQRRLDEIGKRRRGRKLPYFQVDLSEFDELAHDAV